MELYTTITIYSVSILFTFLYVIIVLFTNICSQNDTDNVKKKIISEYKNNPIVVKWRKSFKTLICQKQALKTYTRS